MIVTHILVLNSLSAKPSQSLESTDGWKRLVHALTSGTGRPVYTGREQEDTNRYYLLSEWPSVEAWSRNGDVQQSIQALENSGSAQQSASYSVAIQSEDRKALEAPTTEISIGFVQAGSDAAIRLGQATTIYAQKAAISEVAGGAVGTVSGWTYDKDIDFTTNSGTRSRGRGYLSLLGWASKAAHLDFPEAAIGIADILAAGAEGWWVGHVNFSKTLP